MPNQSFVYMEALRRTLKRGTESDFFFFNGDHCDKIENGLGQEGSSGQETYNPVSGSECIDFQKRCYILVCHDVHSYLLLVKLKCL